MKSKIAFVVVPFLLALSQGCGDNKCPESLKGEITSIGNDAKRVLQMPEGTKPEKAAKATALEGVVNRCNKMLTDNKDNAECKIDDTHKWDTTGDKKACAILETKLASLKQ